MPLIVEARLRCKIEAKILIKCILLLPYVFYQITICIKRCAEYKFSAFVFKYKMI